MASLEELDFLNKLKEWIEKTFMKIGFEGFSFLDDIRHSLVTRVQEGFIL